LNPNIRENEDKNVTSHNQSGVTKCTINNIYSSLRNRSDAYNTTGEKNTHIHTYTHAHTHTHTHTHTHKPLH